jgi:hypothetical protein
MNPKQKNTLQIEFVSRQQMNRFARFLNKKDNLGKYINGKGEKTLFLSFDSEFVRERVKEVFIKLVKNIEVIKYDSGLDKLRLK